MNEKIDRIEKLLQYIIILLHEIVEEREKNDEKPIRLNTLEAIKKVLNF